MKLNVIKFNVGQLVDIELECIFEVSVGWDLHRLIELYPKIQPWAAACVVNISRQPVNLIVELIVGTAVTVA